MGDTGTTPDGSTNTMNEMNNEGGPKSNIADLYNRVASVYGCVGPDSFAYAGRHLVERAGITAGARVLDVGVGRGANLFPAAEKVGPRGQVIGIDLADQMLAETTAEIERRHILNASVRQMDAEQLAFDSASFDYVLCGFAVFLFPHLEQALSEFFRVLHSSGKLGITVGHDPDALSRWYSQRLTEYHNQYHFPLNASGVNLDLSKLPAYLVRAGFVDVHVLYENAEFIYTGAQQWWDAKWTHGTRYSLEHMTPEVLEQFKTEVFARLEEEKRPDGIHEEWHLQFVLGTRGTESE
ncbi:MAG TPA: methyltransferase domain-containing protein [Ktedonobacteraceae bacterium]|nr:methyltransferase domain-containing protein [Ktedonobacteraceae bacterium]